MTKVNDAMKDISIYFKPVSIKDEIKPESLGESIFMHDENGFPEIDSKGVAIIYVPEFRNSDLSIEKENESFRDQLYQFNKGDNWMFSIYDLGTIAPGEKVEDTYFALSQAISELVKKGVVPVIIGGSQDLTLACYKGFECLEQMVNICAVDSCLDVGDPKDPLRADSFVSHLLMQRPCYLFNYANLGMQRPLVKRKEIELFEKLYFDVSRLGELNSDYKLSEPYLRNSDILSIDFKSIRNSETDASVYDNANGFYAEQICQIAKYAGISDKMSCVGIFDVLPKQQTAASNLLAQIIWYFIDGMAQRVGDFPIGSKKNYTKFHVRLEDFQEDLVFYRSNKSDRWWLEVKYLTPDNNKYERHCLIPCDQKDYDNAMRNEIPNLWWKTLQKLS